MWLDWLVFCDCGFSLSALWFPLLVPTVWLVFLLPWHGLSLHGCSSKVQPLLLASVGYLLWAAPALSSHHLLLQHRLPLQGPAAATPALHSYSLRLKHLISIIYSSSLQKISKDIVELNSTISQLDLIDYCCCSVAQSYLFVMPWTTACQASLFLII